MERYYGFSGELKAKVVRAPKAPISWRIKNAIQPVYWGGFIANLAAKALTKITGIPTLTAELEARVIKSDGSVIDYGVVSYRVVTDTGVASLVDDWQAGTPRINDLKYAGVGTGTAAEDQTDAALGTESTTVLNPDSTRATCTMTQPSANVVRAVGTLTFDGSAAITEHGIFNQAATGGGVMWDRSVFSAINVASGDSIQLTYNLTVNANG
jgi:hypothetical protein